MVPPFYQSERFLFSLIPFISKKAWRRCLHFCTRKCTSITGSFCCSFLCNGALRTRTVGIAFEIVKLHRAALTVSDTPWRRCQIYYYAESLRNRRINFFYRKVHLIRFITYIPDSSQLNSRVLVSSLEEITPAAPLPFILHDDFRGHIL